MFSTIHIACFSSVKADDWRMNVCVIRLPYTVLAGLGLVAQLLLPWEPRTLFISMIDHG